MNNKKVALISGANKGIGFEVARQLGHAGYTILLGARNAELGAQAAATLRAEHLDIEPIHLDLADEQTIQAAAALVGDEYGKLDILVNNAGIVDPADGSPTKASVDAVARVMQTNFLAAVSLTQAMLTHLRAAEAGRIVNVSSGLGSITLNGDPNWPYAAYKFLGYSASKAALNMFTAQLAYELRDTSIKVNAADPGYTATDLNNNSGHQTIQQGAAEAVRLALLSADGPTGGFFATEGPQPW